MNERNKPCSERISAKLASRVRDLEVSFRAYQRGKEDENSDVSTFPEYGLGFDYVPKGTFGDQKEGYFRYQLSWGGPSDEFRFFCGADRELVRVEYWFMDWFDGAKRVLRGKRLELLTDIFAFFSECGSVESALAEARE